MKKNTKKALAGLTLAASALSVNAAADEFVLGEYPLSAAEAHRAEYTKIANVQGSFRFTQDVLSPSEDVFNLYGTAVTGMCASPPLPSKPAKRTWAVIISTSPAA